MCDRKKTADFTLLYTLNDWLEVKLNSHFIQAIYFSLIYTTTILCTLQVCHLIGIF